MNAQLQISEVVERVTDFIGKQEDHFTKLNENCYNRLDFAKEAEFALMQLIKNDYILDVARKNPDSLYSAISSIASIGISLSPAEKLAYLVPRKINGQQAICLDISYMGLCKLATDTGRVQAIKAELVYENDTYDYKGFDVDPNFSANPFGDRGKLIGVYAKAILTPVDGVTRVLVENMAIDEVFAIRDDTEAYKAVLKKHGEDSYQFKNLGWVKYEGEFVKKTVLKRACKTLPKSDGSATLSEAIHVIDAHEGIDFDAVEETPAIEYTTGQQDEYERCIKEDDYFNLAGLITTLDADSQLQLSRFNPVGEKGNKMAVQKQFKEDCQDGRMKLEDTINLIRERIENGDDGDVPELVDGCSEWTMEFIMQQLSGSHRQAVTEILEQSND